MKNGNIIYGWNDEPCIGMRIETNPDLASICPIPHYVFWHERRTLCIYCCDVPRFFRMSKWDIPYEY